MPPPALQSPVIRMVLLGQLCSSATAQITRGELDELRASMLAQITSLQTHITSIEGRVSALEAENKELRSQNEMRRGGAAVRQVSTDAFGGMGRQLSEVECCRWTPKYPTCTSNA